MMRFFSSLVLLVALSAPMQAQSVAAVTAFDADLFAPVELVVAPGQPDRAYLVEQGVVRPSFRARVVTLQTGDSAAETFLDLDAAIPDVLRGGEQGALGLAFHPNYATNGRLFVSYTASEPRRSVVSEFARSASTPLRADPGSARILLEVPQPAGNHNGGQIAFGPDGFLYIALGDGGDQEDPRRNGQNLTNLLGAILRIDVDTVPEGEEYGIPSSNPYALTDGPERDEIYAYGFRNPWKFGFDSETGDLWVADVGESAWEEINRVEVGKNYGWSEVEGPACFRLGCDLTGTELPVFAYQHDGASGGFSISGGMVYRGSAIPSLQGQFLYADYVTRRVWALDATGAQPDTTLLFTVSSGDGISAVREGPGGEPHILVYSSNGPTRVLRVESTPVASEGGPDTAARLDVTGPNPFSDETEIAVTLLEGGPVRVSLHDVLGREVAVLLDGVLVPGASRPLRVSGASLPPGAYTVRVVSGVGGVSVRSLVRVR